MSDQQYLVDIQHLQNCTIISAVNGEEKPGISAGSLSEIHFQLCPAASHLPQSVQILASLLLLFTRSLLPVKGTTISKIANY